MKSPFSGLDPYLEAFRGNVHPRMTAYIADQLQAELPDGLWAQLGIDYFHEPAPPVPESDREWLDQILREKGFR